VRLDKRVIYVGLPQDREVKVGVIRYTHMKNNPCQMSNAPAAGVAAPAVSVIQAGENSVVKRDLKHEAGYD
jgi:hypothetical protein